MDNNDLTREWFELAELDLGTAIFLLQMKPKPLEIICYHCQQCAEKFLKGFIANNGGLIAKSHDLLFLIKNAVNIMLGSKRLRNHA